MALWQRHFVDDLVEAEADRADEHDEIPEHPMRRFLRSHVRRMIAVVRCGVIFMSSRVGDDSNAEEGDEDGREREMGKTGFEEEQGEAIRPECCGCVQRRQICCAV